MNKSTIKENIIMIGSFIIIGFLAIYIIIQLVAPSLSVSIFGFKPYIVITESMEPEINVNDMVFVRKFKLDEAEVGDIITFEADIDYNGSKEVVTHYIYAINSNGDVTTIQTNRHWEDAASIAPDPWVLEPDDVLGAYWFQIPKIGYITEFIRSPFGIAALLVNAGVIGGIIVLLKQGKKQLIETEKPDEE